MRRTIRTADEGMEGVVGSILFAMVWYASLLTSIFNVGFDAGVLIFLAAGLIPLLQAANIIRRAVYYRRLHNQCVREGHPEQGRIVNVTKECSDEYVGERRRRRRYYYLTIEVISRETGLPYTIKSEAYRAPVYKYLRSPNVQVYTDPTGWKRVIDGFELKQNRSEPDIFMENSNVYLKDFDQQSVVIKGIYVFVLALMLLRILGIIR